MDGVYSLFHPGSRFGPDMKEFAERLRATREAKSLSLADIASTTKIQLKYLRAMEEGNFSFLPPPYVRAFIRDYARALDLDPNEILRQYDAALPSIEGAPKPQQFEKKPVQAKPSIEDEMAELQRGILRSLWLSFGDFLKQDRTRKKLISGVSVLILLLLLMFIVEMTRNSRGNSTPETPFEQIIKEKEQALATHPDSAHTNIALPPGGAMSDSLVLDGRTTHKVWMRLYIDDRPPVEYILLPNMQREWRARNKFQISLGDAGGISFKINGKDLGTLGKSGAVVRNVILTHEGIQK